MLFIISWKLSLVAVVIIPFSQMVITTIGKSIRRKSRRNTKQIGGILSIITETLSSIRIVKSFAMEAFEINRFNNEFGLGDNKRGNITVEKIAKEEGFLCDSIGPVVKWADIICCLVTDQYMADMYKKEISK